MRGGFIFRCTSSVQVPSILVLFAHSIISATYPPLGVQAHEHDAKQESGFLCCLLALSASVDIRAAISGHCVVSLLAPGASDVEGLVREPEALLQRAAVLRNHVCWVQGWPAASLSSGGPPAVLKMPSLGSGYRIAVPPALFRHLGCRWALIAAWAGDRARSKVSVRFSV